MGNFATVQAITTNLQTILKAQGANFSLAIHETDNVPASLLPLGEVMYEGETFEDTFNQRPSYVDVRWTLRVVLREKTQDSLARELQRWTERIRTAITVDALNTGDLAASLLVSRAELRETRVEPTKDAAMKALLAEVVIRYRET